MKKKFLLGATVDKEIVFANVEITKRNGYPEFTASFDTVHPFSEKEADLKERLEDLIEECGSDFTLEKCREYECSPQDLSSKMVESLEVMDIVDCSLFPEFYEIGNDTWWFESSGWGQCDTRGWMELYVNKEAYDELHFLWDIYHLKKVDEEYITGILDSIESKLNVDWEEWITEYIEKNIKAKETEDTEMRDGGREIKTFLLKTEWEEYKDCYFKVGEYLYGGKAISIMNDEEGPIATITVHIDYKKLKGNIILDTNNCPWVEELLSSLGILERVITYVVSGYCAYPVAKINWEKVYEYAATENA